MWLGEGIKPVDEIVEYMRCQSWRTTSGKAKAIFNGIDIDLSGFPDGPGFESLDPMVIYGVVPEGEETYEMTTVATPTHTPSSATSRRRPTSRPDREERERARAHDSGCKCNIC